MQVGTVNVTAGYRLKDNTSSGHSPTRVTSHTWLLLFQLSFLNFVSVYFWNFLILIYPHCLFFRHCLEIIYVIILNCFFDKIFYFIFISLYNQSNNVYSIELFNASPSPPPYYGHNGPISYFFDDPCSIPTSKVLPYFQRNWLK